ncbi:amino acid adenylation domain-containing protein [Serratia ficaria]|uniref:non-ribosomal peptide synthetase/type I polyketide synthase n=1 Tax=Serratia ficaria TaxID=61651 RepID=UPI000E25EA6F|nr:non-ribosomal peptide synthetase/type I polyketide synthase [Serratia ficaria]REF43107.1 amino acid adenylation domain-containing protein [Serratia ficaria]
MKTMEKVKKNSPIDMLAQVLETPLTELSKSTSTLFGVLGVDSLTATRVRGMLKPAPSYQELYGLTVGQIIERMGASLCEADNDAADRKHNGSDEMAPLTPMQGSYILGAEQGCSCQVYSEFDVEGLDVDAFKRAVTSVIDDEPMLHAVIVNGNQQKLVDRYEKRHEFSFSVDNVTDLDFRRSECINAVKYTDEVFWGIQLTRISTKVTRIHIILDMLFIDATSAMILCQRVIERYNASIDGIEYIAQELPSLRFFDYCLAERDGDVSSNSLAYWEEKIKGIPGPPQIPRVKYDVSHSEKFERCSATLNTDDWGKIKSISSELQITPNSILLSAFAEVLRLYSENAEFTITVTMSERPVAVNNDYSGVVGEFTNVLLCPVTSMGSKGVIDQAISFHHTLSAGLEHSGINGLDIIRMLRKHHNDPHLTFPVVFTSFIGIIKPGLELTGCKTKLNYQQTQTPQISLDHQVYETGNGLQINWDYDGRVHQGKQIAEMLRCFHCVLENVALNQPQSMLLPPELMQIREEMNDTGCEFDELEKGLLHQPVINAAKVFPDKIAVIDQSVSLTYRSLISVANAIAVKLQDIGIGPGHSVAVVLEKGWEQVAGTLGILMTGACYLPLNPSNPDDRLRSIMQLAGCQVALVHDKTLSPERDWYVGGGGQSPATINVHVDMVQEIENREAAPVAIDPHSLAYIIFTSGSTGVPKGVEIAHRAALNTCLDINQRFALGQETVTFGISSLSFDLSVWDIFGTLAAGGTLVVCKPDGTRDPDYWWQQIQQHHVTVWNTVPTSFEMLIAASQPEYVMPLKKVMLSGDAISMAMADNAMARYPQLQIIALGGATEASIWSNYHVVTADSHLLGTELVPYGRPLSNQTMHVLDAGLQYRPTGVVGDIYIGGKGVAEGYFRDPTLTGEKFVHTERYGRLYETGDLGRYLANGEIEIVGRKDSQVKVGGHRVELAEIENCAQQLSEVQRAVAVHIPGAGARVVGFATANADEEKTGLEEKLRIHIEQLLPDYMAPQMWIVLDAIPLTANNKVDMKKLRIIAQTLPAEGEESDTGVETSSEVALVLQLAAQVLDVPVGTLSASRSLIEQGLTSLYAVQLINMLKKAWNKPLSYTLIFNYPSAMKLAACHRDQLSNQHGAAPVATRPAPNYHSEPIAIIARACRLPGNVGSPDEFWHMLSSATDCMSDIPASRFDISPIYDTNPDTLGATYTRRGAFIERAESFDYAWFDLPQAEARTMDPQQRIMLEVAYEACLAAGYNREKLSGSSTGVLIGQMNYDWMMDFGHTKEYAGTGAAPSITSNRISYLLDLAGPSMTIDSACSSSLVAVDTAVAKLRSGACRMAIAGGVNLILSPEPYVFTCQAKMLSVDGRCATFDAQANGIARGEGVGAVVLKRLCDAEADGDPILGVIKGCAVNQDGRSASLTAPNGLAQEAVIRQALQEAGWQGADLDYVECHGTGTPLGDPIEIEALKNVLAVDRKKPVVLGSVKTNIGHLEGAAGITGLIKALEVLRHREAPANLHFHTLNPKINLSGFAAVVPVKSTCIGSHDRKGAVRVGVSSFGYGGTNAHVVLESYDRPSGKARARQDAWLFTGQGALQSGAAAALHAANPVFRDALARYTGQLTAWVDAPLLQWLLEASPEHSACLQETQYQQPALVALQLAQAAMWQARGLAPSHVLGHSIGEFAAAVVAGVMESDDALMLAARRGQLMADCEPGGMAAIRDAAENVRCVLPADVVIAAENGEGMTVVAGPHDALAAFVQQHYAHEHTVLAVSHAFHSPMMAPAALAFGEVVGAVPLRAPAEGVQFISTLTGEAAAEALQTAAYWSEQITQPVRFLQAVRTLLGQGGTPDGVFEIGPGATLINMAKRIAPDVRTQWVASADTLRGTPALNPFIYVPLQWEKPVPKQTLRRSASAEPAVSAADMLYQTQWMPAEPPAEVNGSGPYLLLSRHKVPVALPKDWISMVANDPAEIAAALTEKDWNTVALFSEGDEEDVVQALNVLKSGMTARLVLLKRADSEGDAGLWGLARTARLEQQALRLSCLALFRGQLMQALSLCVCEDMEDECRLSDMGELQVPRLQRYQPPSGEGNDIRAGATYLISGGNGALGQLAAQYLAEQGATHLVLLSRSGQPMAPVPQWGKSIQLASLACDVAEADQVKAVLRQLAVWGWPDIAGVIHTAGVLTDGVLVNQSAEMFMQAQAAKVLGARHLHDILSPTDFIVLYSSVAATLGSAGQASYAAANSALDALAERWAQAGECALSIQWGAWSDVGMAVRSHAVSRIEQSGYGLLDNESGISLLARLLQSRSSGVICASPIVWRKLSHFSPRFSSFMTTVTAPMATPSASSADVQAEWSADDVRRLVRESIEPFLSEKRFDEDLPFMEAGLSSLDLVQIRQALLKSLPTSLELPAHFVFNYPTARDVGLHLIEQLGVKASAVSTVVWQRLNDKTDGEPLFLIGGVMGNAEKTFGTLAQALSVPVYAAMPAIPADPLAQQVTLESVAAALREAMLREVPSPSYSIGGLSFGAALALEVGLHLEAQQRLSRVIMFDPRHLVPFIAPPKPAPFETLLENYVAPRQLFAPVLLFQSTIPPIDTQSEMMREASRSFQNDADVIKRCHELASTLEVIPCDGHHFNLLYKHYQPLVRKIEEEMIPPIPERGDCEEEAIAIIGTSCRLPGNVSSPEDFWQMMLAGTDCVGNIPASRFDIDEVYDPNRDAAGCSYTRQGAFISHAEDFDYAFFGISLAEAKVMDPQQRLLLEVAYDAFHSAGLNKASLKGSSTSVHIGLANDDWSSMGRDEEAHNPYFGAGVSGSISSNRISYLLGLTGPSVTIDTACSSSLVAVDLAVDKLRQGICSMALVGGVNVMLHHRMFVSACATKALSSQGRCATFDEAADGYCRGEGAGAVVLKRLSDAEADGDAILAVIRGTAVNQDGRSVSMTAPNGLAQEAVITRALAEAGLRGQDVDYIECHGTGTPLGDPIEVDALKKVLAVDRKKPVVLGSVKTNIGHLEGAAGVIGLIKAVEVLRHRQAPGNVHFRTLNPNIDLDGFDAIISAEPVPLGGKVRWLPGSPRSASAAPTRMWCWSPTNGHRAIRTRVPAIPLTSCHGAVCPTRCSAAATWAALPPR